MKTSEIITFCDLCSQGIELLRGVCGTCPVVAQLPFANGVHDFHARDRTAGRPKRLEASIGRVSRFTAR